MNESSRQLLEIASWRVIAEMVRRHPGICVIETHPGGGQYDCLELLLPIDGRDIPGARITLNRLGSVHYWPVSGDSNLTWTTFWSEYLAAGDPLEIITRLETIASLKSPGTLPPSTPAVVTYRFIAAFLSQAVFGRQMWECRSGVLDTSGEEPTLRHEWFDSCPKAEGHLRHRQEEDLFGQPGYRFWFLVRDNAPALCLETTGHAWDTSGVRFDLVKLYQARHRIWPVVNFVARDLLP